MLKQLLGGEHELDASEFDEMWRQIDDNEDGAWYQTNRVN